ncbi:MAG: IS1595 family transposase [Pseudoprimorskyibacter sp.]|nr:IS1595 family transposase [Pseudoprimorskyibacter sp.]
MDCALARRLGLNKHTVWCWHLIALSALSGIPDMAFSGIVEVDETYQKESRKGSREWVRHQRDPLNYPKPPRMRWYEYGKKGVPMLRGLSKWPLPILTVVDRSGARCLQRIPNRNHSTIKQALSPMLAPDAVLCTDADPAYKALSKTQGFEHFIVRSKPGQKDHVGLISHPERQFSAFAL